MPSASNRSSKRRWRRTASRRHNAPKLRQVTILARESLTTLPRFVASLSRRAAKRPFPAVGLNVAEGWKAVIRPRLNYSSAPKYSRLKLGHTDKPKPDHVEMAALRRARQGITGS
jgi:hypothetical protein